VIAAEIEPLFGSSSEMLLSSFLFSCNIQKFLLRLVECQVLKIGNRIESVCLRELQSVEQRILISNWIFTRWRVITSAIRKYYRNALGVSQVAIQFRLEDEGILPGRGSVDLH